MTRGLLDSQIAREVSLDLSPGQYVNLGIGLPGMVNAYVSADREVVFHCENGIVGMGQRAIGDAIDWQLVDAAKTPITVVDGAAYVDHPTSFTIVRGGHLDVAVLGAFEVSVSGDLANWYTGSGIPAVGGAMDLAAGARAIYVMSRHLTARGEPKLVRSCSLPLTAPGVVDRIYTDAGIFEPRGDAFEVIGIAPGYSIEQLQDMTGAPVRAAAHVVSLPRDDCE